MTETTSSSVIAMFRPALTNISNGGKEHYSERETERAEEGKKVDEWGKFHTAKINCQTDGSDISFKAKAKKIKKSVDEWGNMVELFARIDTSYLAFYEFHPCCLKLNNKKQPVEWKCFLAMSSFNCSSRVSWPFINQSNMLSFRYLFLLPCMQHWHNQLMI